MDVRFKKQKVLFANEEKKCVQSKVVQRFVSFAANFPLL